MACWSVLCSLILVFGEISAAQQGVFWHISDFHYDPQPEAKRSCIKGVAVTDDQVRGYGVAWCDTTWALVNSSIHAMKSIEPNPEFIVWTGDDTLHYVHGVGTQHEVVGILTNISQLIDQLFPDTPVLASLGNHDYVPDNQVPDSTNEIYQNISQLWTELGWINTTYGDQDNFKNYGYYVRELPSGVIGLALNTNYYYSGNHLFKNEPEDPGNQFDFINSVCERARTDSKKVLVTAHISYGNGIAGYKYTHDKYNTKFRSTIQQNSDVIITSLFGHEHSDAFKLITDGGKVYGSALLAASITPWRWNPNAPAHNPAIRLVELDYSKNIVKDFTQYYLDYDSVSRGGETLWRKHYTFTELYKTPDVSPESLMKVAARINENETIGLTYYRNLYVGGHNITSCDQACRRDLYCSITKIDQSDNDKCRNPPQPNSSTLINISSCLAILCGLIYLH